MNFEKQIERIEKVHDLIRLERTGSPSAFADKLGISLSQLNEDLDFFKDMRTDVKYSVKKETFYYAESLNLEFVSI